jgi:N-acetylneuraminate synthase
MTAPSPSVPPSIAVGDTAIGPEHEPFVIAEISGNHNGELDRALEIVDAAAEAGAHAIKLQTYRADTITIDADGEAFRVSGDHALWAGRNLYQLYEQAHTPWEWHAPLFERIRSHGVIPFSSPFDPTAIDLLEDLDAPLYKIASLEVIDLPLIRQVAEKGKPVILSTGAATVAEIDDAVRAVRETGNEHLVLLACTSSYPASPRESHLRKIPVMGALWHAHIGLSDHTMGIGAAVASVALGSCVIEKHVTLRRDDGGVDSDFSLEPAELASLVRETKVAWESLGEPQMGPTPGEAESRRLRRSLYVVQDVRAGDEVGPENVRSIRPGGGLAPDAMREVAGRRFTRDAARGTALTWDLI